MIYFIQEKETTNIKIGYSSDVERRITSMRTSNSSELILLGCFKGSYKEETNLHRKFDRYRKRGEWFISSPEILDYIEKCNLDGSLKLNYTKVTLGIKILTEKDDEEVRLTSKVFAEDVDF